MCSAARLLVVKMPIIWYNKNMSKYSILLIVISLFFTISCEKKEETTEKLQYNSYFVYPVDNINKDNSPKTYVGTVKGLSSCKYIVSKYYSDRRKFIKGDWDYMCCVRTKESSCAEQHRYHSE